LSPPPQPAGAAISPRSPPPSRPEAAAAASEVRLQAVWDFAGDAMALSDPEGVLLAANPVYYALYGYAPAELLGQCF
jgi:PAS domain-containing protein